MVSSNKVVFTFEEGDGKNKKLLGGKGANLCERTRIGLAVPPGFVISTEACLFYLAQKKEGLQPDLMNQVRESMAYLEKKTGRGFGSAEQPLLVSVRSGAAMSMPGMDMVAPDLTETRSGRSGSPRPLPVFFSSSFVAALTSSMSAAFKLFLFWAR